MVKGVPLSGPPHHVGDYGGVVEVAAMMPFISVPCIFTRILILVYLRGWLTKHYALFSFSSPRKEADLKGG